MALFGNSIDKAAADIRALQKRRQDVESRRTATRAQLAELQATPDSAILDEIFSAEAGVAGKTRRKISDLEGQLIDIDRAARALVHRIQECVVRLAGHQADSLRTEAARLRSELATRSARTAELVAELEAHEGVRFAPAVPAVPPPGVYFEPIVMKVSKSRQLEIRIRQLETEANVVVSRANAKTANGGRVEASDLDGLLQGIAAADSIAPFADALRDWFSQAVSQPRTRYAPSVDHGTIAGWARHYVVTWDATGRIDRKNSYCIALEPGPRTGLAVAS